MAKSRQSLEAAKLLLNSGLSEDAISRAYYAMFHAAEALLEQRQIDVSSHRGVMSAVGQEWVRTGQLSRTLIRNLQDAFRRRQEADYATPSGLNQEDAAEVIQWAEEFLAAAQQLLQNAP
jgi:hypothetical protein